MKVSQSVVKKYPVLGSSANPTELSTTIRGILTALVPVILAISGVYGLDLGEAGLMDAIELTIQAINSIVLSVGAIMAAFGALRKLYYKVKK